MSYISAFSIKDLKEGSKLRNRVGDKYEYLKIGKYFLGKGWQINLGGEDLYKKESKFLYIPDNDWPGSFELFVEE